MDWKHLVGFMTALFLGCLTVGALSLLLTVVVVGVESVLWDAPVLSRWLFQDDSLGQLAIVAVLALSMLAFARVYERLLRL